MGAQPENAGVLTMPWEWQQVARDTAGSKIDFPYQIGKIMIQEETEEYDGGIVSSVMVSIPVHILL